LEQIRKPDSQKSFWKLEKILGTIHIAFGNNSDIRGGKNPYKNHISLLISKLTVSIINNDNSGNSVLVNVT
jgi:leucyl aminopeptidase (aminopeptidase T)